MFRLKKVKNIRLAILLIVISLFTVSCGQKEKQNVAEKSEETSEGFSVVLENPNQFAFDSMSLGYTGVKEDGNVGVSAFGSRQGNDYVFLVKSELPDTTYTIKGRAEGEEVFKFEFSLKENKSEEVNLILTKDENDLFVVKAKDENDKNIIFLEPEAEPAEVVEESAQPV